MLSSANSFGEYEGSVMMKKSRKGGCWALYNPLVSRAHGGMDPGRLQWLADLAK